jgi:hypothetical protein
MLRFFSWNHRRPRTLIALGVLVIVAMYLTTWLVIEWRQKQAIIEVCVVDVERKNDALTVTLSLRVTHPEAIDVLGMSSPQVFLSDGGGSVVMTVNSMSNVQLQMNTPLPETLTFHGTGFPSGAEIRGALQFQIFYEQRARLGQQILGYVSHRGLTSLQVQFDTSEATNEDCASVRFPVR